MIIGPHAVAVNDYRTLMQCKDYRTLMQCKCKEQAASLRLVGKEDLISGGASNPPSVIDAVSGPVSDPVEQSRDGSLASRAGQHCADLSIALPLIRVSPTRSASPTPALGDDSNPDPMDEDRVAVLVDSFQSRHGKPLTLKVYDLARQSQVPSSCIWYYRTLR